MPEQTTIRRAGKAESELEHLAVAATTRFFIDAFKNQTLPAELFRPAPRDSDNPAPGEKFQVMPGHIFLDENGQDLLLISFNSTGNHPRGVILDLNSKAPARLINGEQEVHDDAEQLIRSHPGSLPRVFISPSKTELENYKQQLLGTFTDQTISLGRGRAFDGTEAASELIVAFRHEP